MKRAIFLILMFLLAFSSQTVGAQKRKKHNRIPQNQGAGSTHNFTVRLKNGSLLQGTTRKICQVTGSAVRMKSGKSMGDLGFQGTDLGFPILHNGKLYILFGDTPNTNARAEDEKGDALALSTDTNPDDCLMIDDFVHSGVGSYIKGVSQRSFEVPTGGFSATLKNGKKVLYAYFATDTFHYYLNDQGKRVQIDNPKDPRLPEGKQAKRIRQKTILAKSEDEGRSFIKVHDFSGNTKETIGTAKEGHFTNVVPVVTDNFEPTPGQKGEIVFLFGSGDYRKSDPYLAYVPVSEIEDPTKVRYFKGLLPKEGALRPDWSSMDFESAPLFKHPCLGNFSVTWNPSLSKWIMLYDCKLKEDAGDRKIEMRLADKPWGPWSEEIEIFNAKTGREVDKFIKPKGTVYAPYQIASFAKGNKIYYLLSTWKPYQVFLMETEINN